MKPMISAVFSNRKYSSYNIPKATPRVSFGSRCHMKDEFSLSPEAISAGRLARRLEKRAHQAAKVNLKPKTEPPLQTINHFSKTMDIKAKGEFPTNVLSNYHREEKPFLVDGVECNSIEGFLQAIKQSDVEMQNEICKRSGSRAKYIGKTFLWGWRLDQKLHWQGKTFDRNSKEYQALLEKVFKARFEQCPAFREALECSKGYALIHTCGRNDITRTVLTEKEFIRILNKLRKLL